MAALDARVLAQPVANPESEVLLDSCRGVSIAEPRLRVRHLLLGSLLLLAAALARQRLIWSRAKVERPDVTDFWDEDIIKGKGDAQDESCGFNGCGTMLATCDCHHSCTQRGTCCSDYREVCQASMKTSQEKGRCASYGCSNSYRYDHSCQCVPSCVDFDDCCHDFKYHCGANLSAVEAMPSKDQEPKPVDPFVPKPLAAAGADQNHKAFEKKRDAWLELFKWQAVRSCPPQFLDKTFVGGKQLKKEFKITTAALCQKICTDTPHCDGFVWAASGTCLLAELGGAMPMMMLQDGLIAGLPCCRPGEHREAHTACPERLLDTEVTATGFHEVKAHSSYECQEACSNTTECGAFSWAPPHRCSLKRLGPEETAHTKAKAGVVSGLPCGCRATPANALWPESDEEKFAMPLPRGAEPVKMGSLLCLALMLPYSYEAGLLVMQYKEHAGIFACDEYQVYSSQAMVLAPGLETRKVLSSQLCEVGGEFKSALNLRIFASFWRQVIAEGQYLLYNWIVKADPDTVFFPSRLRPILRRHAGGSMSQQSPGPYFNNCKFGMHGPLEIFSLATVRALGTSFLGCYKFFKKLCSGDCHWGEDLWVDQCLKRFVHAKRIFEGDLLLEAHCDPPEGWQRCDDPKRVAFHPFKTVTDHRLCLNSGRRAVEA